PTLDFHTIAGVDAHLAAAQVHIGHHLTVLRTGEDAPKDRTAETRTDQRDHALHRADRQGGAQPTRVDVLRTTGLQAQSVLRDGLDESRAQDSDDAYLEKWSAWAGFLAFTHGRLPRWAGCNRHARSGDAKVEALFSSRGETVTLRG